MKITNQVLYIETPEINFSEVNKHKLLMLSLNMLKFMKQNKGIGLAANQVGHQERMFVMSPARVCCNPVILSSSEEKGTFPEGCLSFPKKTVSIDRPRRINVKYQDVNGNVHFDELEGLEGICFQHELDHLNGITMYERKKLNESTRETEEN